MASNRFHNNLEDNIITRAQGFGWWEVSMDNSSDWFLASNSPIYKNIYCVIGLENREKVKNELKK